MRKTLVLIVLILCSAFGTWAQTPVALAPIVHMQFLDNNGKPLANGCVFTYTTGTNAPLATYTDSTGISANSNPVILNAGGFADIWIQALTYRFKVVSTGGSLCASGVTQYTIDGVAEKGLIQQVSGAVLLNPPGSANQTVSGPLTAQFFTGTNAHTTSPGVRVAILAADTILDTASNPPTMHTVNPGIAGQIYNVPDPGTGGNYVINPSGNAGTSNVLDCTLTGITCKRTATYFFSGGQCNNATPGMGFDTFGTNSPSPICITGTNVQKGALGLPSAYTHIQSNTGTSAAAGTITTTYPATIPGGNGDMLVLSVAFNSTTTISGCTDTTNAYTQAKHIANGALSVDVWVFHNATTKAAGTTVTCTFVAPATSSLKWHEYQAPGSTSTDVSASSTGTSATCNTGTTASTAQNTELLFAACGDLSNPTLVVSTAAYADHAVLTNGATVQVDDAGLIQQTIATQTTNFALGASPAWAGAIVAFKATNASSAIAQRTVVLPNFFNSAQPINAILKWSNPTTAVATGNAVLGAALICTADASTDDPAFGADTTGTVAIPTSAANVLSNVTLSSLAAGTCASGQTLHYQIKRLRYNASDTYEGFIQVLGSNLQVGITQ